MGLCLFLKAHKLLENLINSHRQLLRRCVRFLVNGLEIPIQQTSSKTVFILVRITKNRMTTLSTEEVLEILGVYDNITALKHAVKDVYKLDWDNFDRLMQSLEVGYRAIGAVNTIESPTGSRNVCYQYLRVFRCDINQDLAIDL